MNDSAISVRYAKALFATASEKGVVENVKSDMETLIYLSSSLPEYTIVLKSPIIGSTDKNNFLIALIGKGVSELTKSFLTMLFANSRESYLTMIARNYLTQYSEYRGVKVAKLSSVTPLDTKVVEQFKEMLSKKYGKEVELSCTTDESLLGGFFLQVDDQQLDASISHRLKTLRRKFVKSN